MSDVKGKVCLGVNAFNENEKVWLYVRNGGNILCVASPRYGKGSLCKNLTVQVSKFKKVCIFDYRGEWTGHVTKPNHYAEYPDSLTDYFVAENFAFPITEFSQFGDWVGFGFEEDASAFMTKIVNSDYHQGEIMKVREMIAALPTSKDGVEEYNGKYGTDLLVFIHQATLGALGRRFEVVQRFFHKGVEDERVVVDFRRVWRQYKHLIIDLSDRRDGFKDLGKARAYAGLILRQMQGEFEWSQGFYVFEEASQMLANPQRLADGSRVGYSELHKIVERMLTLAPKQGVNVLIMAQSRYQVYDNLVVYLPVWLVGRLNVLDELTPAEREMNEFISVNPGSSVREWWLVDTFYKVKVKFMAALPCCEYETNR